MNATYVYNADGKRVKQTLGSTVTNFLWDEASNYGDVVYEYNNTGGALASYVLGGTGLISQTRGTTTNYFLQDGQGSTRGLTSTTGAVTDTYSYTAFGESFATTGTTVNPYRYTGQQLDTSTGLYSLRARYYNPALGRFLSQDTYPVNFGNPVELNRYGYTGNNPINAMDPSGHGLVEYLETQIVKVGAATTAVSYFAARAYTMLAYYVSKLAPYSADEIYNFVSIVQFAGTQLTSGGGGGGWGGGGGGGDDGGDDGDSDEIDPIKAQDEIDWVVENWFDDPYFRRPIDVEGTPTRIITSTRPRFRPEYDPNLNQFGESAPGIYTKIGRASMSGSLYQMRLQILRTIIHEEVHHWIYERRLSQLNRGLAEDITKKYWLMILDGWSGPK